MIPEFLYREGAPYGVLPPGVHFASLEEIEERFATNKRRRELFEGIVKVAETLTRAGCRVMFLDGSYVTDKETPGDFDGCWDPQGVIASMLDPVLLDFKENRESQKRKFGGEMFIAKLPATSSGDVAFLEVFQMDRHTGEAKGIIAIRLDKQR